MPHGITKLQATRTESVMNTGFYMDGIGEGDPDFISGELGNFCACAERQADGNWIWQLDRWDTLAGHARPVSQGIAQSEKLAEIAIRAAIAEHERKD
ncbi:MAG: hypothetical protein WBA42_21395 [Mesorhizobium sp.]